MQTNVMKFFYKFVPLIPYKRDQHEEHIKIINNNILACVWNISPAITSIYFLLQIISSVAQLFFIYTLGSSINNNVSTTHNIYILFSLTILFLISGAILMRIDAFWGRQLIKKYEYRLLSVKADKIELNKLERLSTRDLNLVLDNIMSAQSVIITPVFIFITTILSFYLYGIAGLFVISLIIILLPISHILSKLSDKNYQKIMDRTAERIELGSTWVKHGAYLKSIKNIQDLTKISRHVQEEVQLRNKDTFLKGLETYTIGFGRLFPYILTVILGIGLISTEWGGIIVWLSLPILSAILSFPQSYMAFKQANRSLAQLKELITISSCGETNNVNQPTLKKTITFSKEWPIWPTTLGELLQGKETTLAESFIEELLEVFLFIPEFGHNAQQALQKFIDYDGKNISDGQYFRLQLLRGVVLAHATQTTLYINESFANLDAIAAIRILNYLKKMENVVITDKIIKSYENLATSNTYTSKRLTSNDTKRTYSTVTEEERKPSKVKKRFESLTKSSLLSFCAISIPTFMLMFMTNLTLPEYTISYWWIILYILIGIIIGTLAMVYIEYLLRKESCTRFLEGLHNIREERQETYLQVISRDLTTCFERIAWYFQDIVSITALIFGNMLILWLSYGLYGLGVVLAFGFLLFTIYRLSIESLYTTRIQSVKGFDALTRSTYIAYAISKAKNTSLAPYITYFMQWYKKNIQEQLEQFYKTRLQSVICRGVLSLLCRFISDITLVIIVALYSNFSTTQEAFVLIVSAFLLIRSNLSNAFLAITGFKSQAISLDRLALFASPYSYVPMKVTNDKIKISGFIARQTYKEQIFMRGKVYSLSGSSGGGKSEYLKGVANIIPTYSDNKNQIVTSNYEKAIYIGVKTLNILGLKILSFDDILPLIASTIDSSYYKTITDNKNNIHQSLVYTDCSPTLRKKELTTSPLIILDEVFSCVDAKKFTDLKKDIENYAKKTNTTIIIVDHRFSFKNTIEIEKLLKKQKVN
ncbi:hypothetical protein [Bartonella sp. DGB1]|uniref:hypothetical protein n=1 Tax=Bartonella sp. DGB1 TaxID=3239807 RepID=UPI00352530BE